MTYFDKSSKVGYDAMDTELNEELERLYEENPKLAKQMNNRIHDGIQCRMREEAGRRCWDLIAQFEKCANSMQLIPFTPIPKESALMCKPELETMNECFHDVNNEDTYQKYRLMFLRGELYELYQQRLEAKIEMYKSAAPDKLHEWKIDYAAKYDDVMSTKIRRRNGSTEATVATAGDERWWLDE
jgi:COX assembly protein 1